MKKRRSIWQNLLIIMSFTTVLIIIITFLVYQNAIDLVKKENCKTNMHQAIQTEENFIRVIEQTERLTAAIDVANETRAFWYSEYPDKIFDDFYTMLGSILTSYTYTMRNYISSVMLYSHSYERMQSQEMDSPYMIKGTVLDRLANADWPASLEEMGTDKVRTQIVVRAVNNSYPYVLTMIKQSRSGSEWGAIAIDIDLTKIYSEIWNHTEEDISVWVLDEDGRVIIREGKNELCADTKEFWELSLFQKTSDEISLLVEDRDIPVAYAQRYIEEYGFYIVAVTELKDFNHMIWQERLESIGIGLGVMLIACGLLLIYAYSAKKSMKDILNLLRNPLDFQEYIAQSEEEVQEVADYIVSNLQLNAALEEELEKRLHSLRESQMQALKAQINPHFLFNTLNVIVMLIDEEVEDSQAAQVTVALAEVLRYSLSDEELVPLSEEIEHTQQYLTILEQRYRGKFETSLDVASELMKVRVPRLILQPIVENAIFHGISAKEEIRGGRLEVTGRKEFFAFEDKEMWAVRIDITDNGQGMTREKIEELLESMRNEQISMSHIGVQNVAKRLALLFPKQSKVEIFSAPGKGTRVSLLFPYNIGDEKEYIK